MEMERDPENATLLPADDSQIASPPNIVRSRTTASNEEGSRSCCSRCCCIRCSKDSLNGWLLFLFWSFLIIAIFLLKYESDQRYETLLSKYWSLQEQMDTVEANNNARYSMLKTNFDTFQTHALKFESDTSQELQQQNESTSQQFHTVWMTVSDHDKALTRLSNGTSNADVLDKLQQTKQQIHELVDHTKSEINDQLVVANHNVSDQIQHSREEFQRTQQEVNDHLDGTVARMKTVVGEATDNIYQVQKNVTNQINLMGVTLSRTVDILKHNVQDAQSTIDEEVKGVKDHIEQYVAFTNKQFAAENDFVKYQLAGLFTLLSCLIFLWHLTQHMRHYSKPDIQNRIMGILWMVPIYGVTSWLSMVSLPSEPYLAAFRDCFESYVVYTFVGFLIAVLSDGLERPQLILKLAKEVEHERFAIERFNNAQSSPMPVEEEGTAKLVKPKEHLVPPCPCCYRRDPISTARSWLNQCQLLAMQFVFVKPLLTVIPLILTVSHVYDVEQIPAFVNNTVNWVSPKLYILIFQNLSVGFAFYGLLSFYHGVEKDLEWCEPWPKFLCIKGVVFLTFWQSIIIQTMGNFGLVDEKAASQISNLLICIEMLIASIAHFYIFPYQEWAPGYQRAKQKSILLRDTMAFGDFLKDMRSMFAKDGLNHSLEVGSPTTTTNNLSPEKASFSQELSTPFHHSRLLLMDDEEEGGGGEGESSQQHPLLTGSKRTEKARMTDQEALIMQELEEKISLLTRLSNEEQDRSSVVVAPGSIPGQSYPGVGDEYYQSSSNNSSPRKKQTPGKEEVKEIHFLDKV